MQATGFECWRPMEPPLLRAAMLTTNVFVDHAQDWQSPGNEPPIKDVIGLATTLSSLALAELTKGTAGHNVALSLRAAINAKPYRGRAWAIKSAARQLAEMIERDTANAPAEKRECNDLPF